MLIFAMIIAVLLVGCEERVEEGNCNIEGCIQGNNPCYRPPESCGGEVGCDGNRCTFLDQDRCEDSSCENYGWETQSDVDGPRATGCWSNDLQLCICYDPDSPYVPGEGVDLC
jgi:hypothetical protein